MSMSRLARRLRSRLEHEGVALPPVVHIDRTYAGRHQKAQGAWSWELCDADGRFLGVGSQHTASECAAAAKLSFWNPWPHTDLHLFVERPRAAGRGAEPGQHPTHRLDQPNQEMSMTERQPDNSIRNESAPQVRKRGVPMSKTRACWPDINAFYAERGGRRSVEYDFGVHHHSDADAHLPMYLRTRWRVSVVESTGDVYAVDANDRTVVLLGTFATRPPGRFAGPMDAAFADWAGGDGPGRPLRWFAERIPEGAAHPDLRETKEHA